MEQGDSEHKSLHTMGGCEELESQAGGQELIGCCQALSRARAAVPTGAGMAGSGREAGNPTQPASLSSSAFSGCSREQCTPLQGRHETGPPVLGTPQRWFSHITRSPSRPPGTHTGILATAPCWVLLPIRMG